MEERDGVKLLAHGQGSDCMERERFGSQVDVRALVARVRCGWIHCVCFHRNVRQDHRHQLR